MSDSDELRDELLQAASGKRGRAHFSESEEDSDEEDARPAARRRVAAASDSDSDEPFDDGYGSDLMGDEEDREKLANMNELDREMILADRASARDDARERHALLQSQRRAARQPARKTTRASRAKKPVNAAKQNQLEELKAARSRKAQPRSRDKDLEAESPEGSGDDGEGAMAGGRARRGPPSVSASEEELGRPSESDDNDVARTSDDDDEGIVDRSRREPEDDEEAEMEAAMTALVRRNMLESWVRKLPLPFLERTLPGALLRLSVGQKPMKDGTSVACYTIGKVENVHMKAPGRHRDATGKAWDTPYPFGPAGARTSLWVTVSRGDSTRDMPLLLVSNSKPTEEEWRRYREEIDKTHGSQMTMADVADVRERLTAALSYKFTSEDVRAMVEQKRAAGLGGHSAAERARQQNLLTAAREAGNLEEVERLEAVVAALEGQAAAAAAKAKGMSMANINQRNKGVNFQNALKNVSSRPGGAAKDGAVDVFARRKTASRNYWATNRHAPAQAEEAEVAPVAITAAAAAVSAAEEPDAPAAHVLQDDVTGAVDVDIDLAVLKIPPPPPLARRLLSRNWRASLSPWAEPPDVASRRQLSLAEYIDRQTRQQI